MSDEQLIEQLNKEACALGPRNFEAKACIPAEPTDTDELLSTAAARIVQLNERVGELERTIEESLSFIKSLPEDSMGFDPHLGYPYRDEMISRFRGALNKEQP